MENIPYTNQEIATQLAKLALLAAQAPSVGDMSTEQRVELFGLAEVLIDDLTKEEK